jgi:hypothetical protein
MITIKSIFEGGSVASKLLGLVWGRPSPTQGFEELKTAFSRLPDEIIEQVTNAQEQSIVDMKKDLMAYPSQRRGSTYIRTYTLRHGWEDAPVISVPTMQGLTPTKITSIENPVPYAGWVQVRSTQKVWNRYRWTTVEDVIERHSPMVIDKIVNVLTILSRSF